MLLSLKQKTFSGFFIAFLKSTWNGEHFQKKGESSSLSISEIIDSKRGGYLSVWKALLQNGFGNQAVNGWQTLLKSARYYYYPIFPRIWDKLSWKRPALVRSKILGLFVNTLTAEYTYSRRNMQSFTQKVQMPLSLKQKTFSWSFTAFAKSTWNGEHFQKKEDSSSLSISEIIDSKRGGYLSAWKAVLQNSFR